MEEAKATGRVKGLAYFVASCGYAGRFPIAPGTVGSLVGVVLDRGLRVVVGWWWGGWGWALVILGFAAVGTWAAGVVEEDVKQKDPSLVVVDELAGMLLAFYLLELSWTGLGLGFLVFRLLDIVKPFPCRRAERLPGGLGIMADDLVAGLYTNGLLRLVGLVWPAIIYHP